MHITLSQLGFLFLHRKLYGFISYLVVLRSETTFQESKMWKAVWEEAGEKLHCTESRNNAMSQQGLLLLIKLDGERKFFRGSKDQEPWCSLVRNFQSQSHGIFQILLIWSSRSPNRFWKQPLLRHQGQQHEPAEWLVEGQCRNQEGPEGAESVGEEGPVPGGICIPWNGKKGVLTLTRCRRVRLTKSIIYSYTIPAILI